MRIAVVGSGIAGLAAAHTLQKEGLGAHSITLYESAGYFGGHTHTVDVTLPGPLGSLTHGVDTGFLVFNERTYPGLIALFDELDVATAHSEMSFSVQVKSPNSRGQMEWSGTSLSSVFAQRRNLFNWRFWRMLRDLNRFNNVCNDLVARGDDVQLRQPLGLFLKQQRFSTEFADWYLLPMVACIWSCPAHQMLEFPVSTLIRFCHNHGLLQISNRPQWWTVRGGARHYVDRIVSGLSDKRLNSPVETIERLASASTGGVRIITAGGVELFDKVIIATHPDQALAMLAEPSPLEMRTLGAIRFHPNRAVLHTDDSVLPDNKSAWAAWKDERHDNSRSAVPLQEAKAGTDVCLHYLINRLQPLPWQQSVIVSLNPVRAVPADKILGEFAYNHPVFDQVAVKAQRQVAWLQGQQNTFYCGAWMGYGFHEDGLTAGVNAARHVLGQLPERMEAPP
jgi:uncharacterized protein